MTIKKSNFKNFNPRLDLIPSLNTTYLIKGNFKGSMKRWIQVLREWERGVEVFSDLFVLLYVPGVYRA